MTDQAATLRAFASQQGVRQPVEMDKAKLWDELKGWLQIKRSEWAAQTSLPWSGPYAQILDRMEKAEILNSRLKPATPETFARVRAEFKGGES